MKNATIETWVWVLIYGGLLAVGLGLAMQQQGTGAAGWALVVGGGVAAAVGVLLIWLRSRRKDEE
jgi:O-antigen/teichoic acid export membrane protein